MAVVRFPRAGVGWGLMVGYHIPYLHDYHQHATGNLCHLEMMLLSILSHTRLSPVDIDFEGAGKA